MSKRRPLSPHCLIVETYDEFRSLIQAFGCGAYELLSIIGDPGVGKSEIVKRIPQQVLGPLGWGLIKGKHTPLDLYERMYRFRRILIVLDDLDDLLQRKENVMLLKCICDTVPVKRVEWGSWHSAFRSGELPKSFSAISRTCLICNDYDTLDRNIAAVHDRGLVISFEPSALEVHRELARGAWFDDEQVFDFIGRNLFLITKPSFRFYITAREHKRAGLDWRGLTLRTIEVEADSKRILVARLLADPQFETLPAPEAARILAFRDHVDGGSKATYYRHKAELLARRGDVEAAEVAAIKLEPYKPDLLYLAQLDRRQQIEQECSLDDVPTVDSGDRSGDLAEANPDLLSRLRREMEKASATEDYELAAKLRDEIRRIEKEQAG